MRRLIGYLLLAGASVGCGSRVDVATERDTLLRLDREWSASVKDTDRFLSYFAPDATMYPPGMALVSGPGPIREMWVQLSSTPGFALEFTPSKAEVSASGDIGYTTGTYKSTMAGATENGKYVTVWKKQPDGNWKVVEDIFNADASIAPAAAHVLVPAGSIAWGDPPPGLPAGAKVAVVSGDPAQAGPFIIRVTMPSGYKVPPHWHPAAENITVLSGTLAVGMGDTWDDAQLQNLATGSFVTMPADMRHYALARATTVIQLHGQGPFAISYVNPADDPRQAK